MDVNALIQLKKNILRPHLEFVESMLMKVQGSNFEGSWLKMQNCIRDDRKMWVRSSIKFKMGLSKIVWLDENNIKMICLVFLYNSFCCFKKSPDQAPYFRVNTVVAAFFLRSLTGLKEALTCKKLIIRDFENKFNPP